jgi:hypothetical protein
VVENPHRADEGYRCSGTYQAACSLLRSRIEETAPGLARGESTP